MLSILRKATESLKKSGESDLVEQYDEVEDLSVWEIVNASLSDDEDCYSLDDDEPEAKPIEEEEEEDAGESRDVTPDDAVFMKSLSVLPPVTFHTNLTRRLVYDDDEEEDDDVYDDDDDDDDLVKWKVKGFGKGRMKMGKRGVRKVKNSKRLPYYYYNRP